MSKGFENRLHPVQAELFDRHGRLTSEACGNTRPAGLCRRKEAVKEAVGRAIANSGLDRQTITCEMSRLVGEEISIHALNNYIAEGKNNRRFPLEYAYALYVITGDVDVINAALGGGMQVLPPDEMKFYELGKITAEERDRRRRKKQIYEEIG
ncbi:MAG: hypothetical protein SWH61_05500 [Thermodesulfobacteriota bacterium]|nr:hypothetical protein [Thermodesulfobacteriota bacterium]